MTFVPNAADYTIAGAIVVAAVIELLLMPYLRKHRVIAYVYMSGYLWATGIAILALWHATGRDWNLLYLGAPGLRTALGGLIAAGICGYMLWERSRVVRSPKTLAALAKKTGAIAWMLPRTRAERGWVIWLSVAAGTCEEIMFRGFLTVFIAHFSNLTAGVLGSALLFGFGHMYQHRSALISTGAFALVMSALVLLSGSLLPAVAFHILYDLVATDLGYHALNADQSVANPNS